MIVAAVALIVVCIIAGGLLLSMQEEKPADGQEAAPALSVEEFEWSIEEAQIHAW